MKALLLIRAELRLQVARLLGALDLVDVAKLGEELFGVGRDVGAADLIEELLDAPRLRERELAAVAATGREDFRLSQENFANLERVELGEGAVGEPHVATPFGEAARELVLRDGDAFALEVQPQRQPIDAARHARVGGERLVSHLDVDQIVGDEEVPLFGQRADALGPELDRVVAARDEFISVFVRREIEIAELGHRVLLRRDVATDALGALVRAAGRGLDDDRHGHAIGAHVDLDVFVGGAERHLRFGERAAGRDAKGRHEIDHVRDLRQLGQLRADFERDLGQPLRDELRQVLDRLVNRRQAHEAPDARRRDAAIDRARPALLRIDVPAGAPLEPCPLRGRELSRIAGALKARLHDDLRAVV